MPLRTDGARLRQLRELKGMTQVEFADAVGYSTNHICKVELGRNNGSLRFLRTAAQVLDCTIVDLTNGTVPRKRSTT